MYFKASKWSGAGLCFTGGSQAQVAHRRAGDGAEPGQTAFTYYSGSTTSRSGIRPCKIDAPHIDPLPAPTVVTPTDVPPTATPTDNTSPTPHRFRTATPTPTTAPVGKFHRSLIRWDSGPASSTGFVSTGSRRRTRQRRRRRLSPACRKYSPADPGIPCEPQIRAYTAMHVRRPRFWSGSRQRPRSLVSERLRAGELFDSLAYVHLDRRLSERA